jgi:hypothetical protein
MWPVELAERYFSIEFSKVYTTQVVGEVTGGKLDGFLLKEH